MRVDVASARERECREDVPPNGVMFANVWRSADQIETDDYPFRLVVNACEIGIGGRD